MKITNSITTLFFMTLGWSSLGSSQVISGQSYKIFSACDLSKVMSVAGGSLLDNAAIVLQTDANKSSQIFKFESSGGGYKVTAVSSGKTLNIAKASTALNAKLEQYKFTGVPSEIFKLSTTSDNYVRLQNLNSGLYVNLVKAATIDNTPFEQWSNSTACAEKFKLTAIAVVVPPPPTPAPAPAPTPTPAPTPARDPLKQPFATNSIWNMPIGSQAVFAPANLSKTPGNNIWATMPGMDEEYIFMTPTAPLTTINFSNVAWSGGNRCGATGGLLASVPMPTNFIVPNGNGNASSSFLMPDKRTITQIQPLARCTAGGPGTSLVKFNDVDIYGDGREGAHGGSRMSAIGGTIRMGELRPGQLGPHHALKMAVYAKEVLFRCSVRSDCYRWPAFTADSYAVGWYGSGNNNLNSQMKMGALLALPASVNISNLGLETAPAKQLAWTLQNYGAYIVDDTYAAGFMFDTEIGPNGRKVDEFKNDYGFAFLGRVNEQASSPWIRDIQRLVQALNVVTNNSATSIGGGGTPRQPLAPAIAP